MTAPVEDDELTALVDPDIPRVDLVDKGANGVPRWLIAKQADGTRGLMDPAFVRDLLGQAEPAPVVKQEGETVTMSGSPAAIARFIHQAARRAADPVEKADLSSAEENDLPDSAFAYIEPGGEKDGEGKTTPRELRHFNISDAAHVRNALSRAPQSPFGDKAMPKIRAAAKKFDIEVTKESDMADEDLDAATVLAEPDNTDSPGLATTPGSPAWEAIDAATARKWTSILARARAAVELLADREMMEATAGAEDDSDEALDLLDACCAIDYAIGVLAPFAVEEQAEADCGADDMAMVGKALAGWDPAPLDTIEALGRVRKAGRVLSSANEAAIRDAVDKLQKVLASLPAAPAPVEKAGAPVVTTTEEPDMSTADLPTPATSAETVAVHGEQPKMGIAKTGEPVAKADGEGKAAMRAVYDAKGRLVGIVDPADITPIEDATPEPDAEPDTAPTPEPAADDMQPAPAAEVGTPADAAPDDVTKTEQETDNTSTTDTLIKGIADVVKAQLDAHSTAQQEVLAKMAGDLEAVTQASEVLKAQVQALEEQPAAPKVFTNGAVPPAHLMRGQDRGSAPVDQAQVSELRKGLYSPVAAERDKAALDLNALAIAELQEIHHRR